jgi:hypothetical protein
MRFRFHAFGVHLLVSAAALTLVLGTLYVGWYRWPGWYVAGVSGVVAVLIGVDLTIGPLMTFIVARSTKTRGELARDIGIIAAVQLAALIYGTASLWHGRPLYYAFSQSELQLVQAYDIGAHEVDVARKLNLQFLPHWYSLPRWIWAPLPKDPQEAAKIVVSAISGGDDVIAMPRYFKHWDQGLPALRTQLKKVDDVAYFSRTEKQTLKERMRKLGLDPDQFNTMPLTGRGKPLLVVFDTASLKIKAIMAPSRRKDLGPDGRRAQLRARTGPRTPALDASPGL